MAGGTGILAARLCTGLRRDGFHRLVSCCDLVAAQLLICGAARAIAIRMSTERRSEARHYALGVGAAVGRGGGGPGGGGGGALAGLHAGWKQYLQATDVGGRGRAAPQLQQILAGVRQHRLHINATLLEGRRCEAQDPAPGGRSTGDR